MAGFTFTTANVGTTLSMMIVGVLGVFLVLGVLVLAVYALNKIFSANNSKKD